MDKFKKITALMLFSASSCSVTAGTMGEQMTTKNNFFVGLGGAYNSIQVKQNIYEIGVANFSGAITSSGVAKGGANPFYGTENTFSPEFQSGFYKQIMDSSYLWGIKFSYQYLGTVVSHEDFTVPQVGSVAGNALVESAQNRINHELLLLPFIGHSFTNSQVYFGAGPALFGIKSVVDGEIGFANLYGNPTDLTGIAINNTSSNWIWGGAAQAGFAYFLSPDWSIDFNYTFAMTPKYGANYVNPFSQYLKADNITTTGLGYTTTSQNLTAQALSVSINKVFSL